MKKINPCHDKERDDFKRLALPFQRRLYRTALILTKSRRRAKELVQETNLNARRHYPRLPPGVNFGAWLYQLLMKNDATEKV